MGAFGNFVREGYQGAKWLNNQRRQAVNEAQTFGRQVFASNFARQGLASTVFAPSPGAAFTSVYRKKLEYGSAKHIGNLENLARQYPNSNINNVITKVKNKSLKSSRLAKVAKRGMGFGGLALGAAFIGAPLFTTPGGPQEKIKATLQGAAGFAAFNVAGKFGAATGAALGTAVLPGIGTLLGMGIGAVAGAFGGSIAAEEITGKLIDIPNNMVERERQKRNLNWVGSQAAFNTGSAHTMRQMSLQAMNHGMMTSRSALGREAVMIHR